MVKIRLSRTGRKHLASFKIVITPVREKQISKFIEYVGHYSPHTKELKVEKERVEYWLSVGAQPTETVKRLLVKAGVLKKSDLPKKKFSKKPGKKAEERKAAKEEKEQAKKSAKETEAKKEEPAEAK